MYKYNKYLPLLFQIFSPIYTIYIQQYFSRKNYKYISVLARLNISHGFLHISSTVFGIFTSLIFVKIKHCNSQKLLNVYEIHRVNITMVTTVL